jgi:hypothetical protein
MANEITKQQQAERLVEKHIIEEINETIQKEFNENPELLYEAENYEKTKKELNEGINEDYWSEPEIYEFWSVSDWLYEKLKARGEIVFDCLDFHVWGRQTTGQAIKLDAVIQEIAEEYNF